MVWKSIRCLCVKVYKLVDLPKNVQTYKNKMKNTRVTDIWFWNETERESERQTDRKRDNETEKQWEWDYIYLFGSPVTFRKLWFWHRVFFVFVFAFGTRFRCLLFQMTDVATHTFFCMIAWLFVLLILSVCFIYSVFFL